MTLNYRALVAALALFISLRYAAIAQSANGGFETGDLSEFSQELEKKIHSEPYRNVAVGACRVREAAGFARYRIALLFF